MGVCAPNMVEWVVLQFATAKAGLILVNINPAYRTSELEFGLNQVGVKALITVPSFKSSDYLAMLAKLMPQLKSAEPGKLKAMKIPELRWVIALGDDPVPGTLLFAAAPLAGPRRRLFRTTISSTTPSSPVCR